jgi:hypothetical protein
MARTNLPVTALSRTAKVVVTPSSGTAIDVANGMVVTGVPMEELVIQVINTFAGAKIVTIQAGANPPALAAAQGAMTGSLAQNEVADFGPFEGARFSQANGDLFIDFEAAMTGNVRALRVPRA